MSLELIGDALEALAAVAGSIVDDKEKCCSCAKVTSEGAWEDEDDDWWCFACIDAWEEKHQAHFFDGVPFSSERPRKLWSAGI